MRNLRDEDRLDGTIAAGVIGVGCLALLFQFALIGAVIFAVIKLVLHFT